MEKHLHISETFSNDLYPMRYRVIVGNDVCRIADELQYELSDDYLGTTIRGMCQEGEKQYLCVEICINPHCQHAKLTPGIIAHEALHACEMTFEHIGAEMTVGEPLNYLLAWITDKIYETAGWNRLMYTES